MTELMTYNNVAIPAFMYGTAWKKEATAQLVELAVMAGFRAIDTANQLIHYQEALVGEALLSLAKKGIPRDSLFLQTKFTSTSGQDHRTPYDASVDLTTQVRQSFESSLNHLHTDYLNSYVLHGPYSRWGLGKADWEVWAAMEEYYRAGKAKIIGISNVQATQLQELCEKASVKPMVVQNRCYAVMGWDKEVREICKRQGIIYQGFSLLTANQDVLRDQAVWDIAKRVGANPLQVIFRFALQVGMLPLTGTTNEQHMKDDLAVLANFELTLEDVNKIEGIAVLEES
ncbi:MAG: aldo/keto reductase [Nitrospirota bacterium]|nr:aldo/keto reductase [Nitrospirota bacterium]